MMESIPTWGRPNLIDEPPITEPPLVDLGESVGPRGDWWIQLGPKLLEAHTAGGTLDAWDRREVCVCDLHRAVTNLYSSLTVAGWTSRLGELLGLVLLECKLAGEHPRELLKAEIQSLMLPSVEPDYKENIL